MSEVYVSKTALTEAVFLSLHDNPHKDGKIRHNHNMEHHHFIHMIYHAPAADVVPVVHGRWIVEREKDTFGYIVHLKCSICEKRNSNGTLYCPNCGARMDLESEGKDE